MKEKVFIIIGIFTFLLLIGGIYYSLMYSSSTYYTQIDNTKIAENDSDGGVINFKGDLEYLYTLNAYNDKGKEKEITFGVSKELKEDAFIKLKIAPIRGVISWEEIQYNELPIIVQEKYNNK